MTWRVSFFWGGLYPLEIFDTLCQRTLRVCARAAIHEDIDALLGCPVRAISSVCRGEGLAGLFAQAHFFWVGSDLSGNIIEVAREGDLDTVQEIPEPVTADGLDILECESRDAIKYFAGLDTFQDAPNLIPIGMPGHIGDGLREGGVFFHGASVSVWRVMVSVSGLTDHLVTVKM